MAGETLGFQVHHIFPRNIMKNFEKSFRELGINLGAEDYSNRINLFDNQEQV